MSTKTASRTPADRSFGDVKLNRKHGIFQLVHAETFRTVFVIEESAEKARTVAHHNRYKGWQEIDYDNQTWLGPEVTVVCLGLAERTQKLGLLARSGEW